MSGLIKSTLYIIIFIISSPSMYYYYIIHGILKRYKNHLKDIVKQKKVVFIFYRSFKNKAIASGILKKLQIFVKLGPFK